MKYCFTANAVTLCTEHCKDCARDIYNDFKETLGKAECVSESVIIDRIGEKAFNVLKQYGFIEACGIICGAKMYAI